MAIKKPAITKTLALRIQIVACVKLDTSQPARTDCSDNENTEQHFQVGDSLLEDIQL